MKFNFQSTGRGTFVLLTPDVPLIDGKTGLPVEFTKRDIHGFNYSMENDVYRVVRALSLLEVYHVC